MASTSRINNRLTALIVDDGEIERMLLPRFLNKLGVDAKTVKNGKEALELFQSGEVFDLVFMDLYMPVMNGLQATRALRQMGVTSSIIGITGESRADEIQKFMEAGLDDCYEKPVSVDTFAAIIHGSVQS